MQRFESYQAQSPCPLCAGRDGTLIATEDRHGQPLPVVCCRGCGLAHVDPIPSQDELAQFYAERYRREYKQATTPRLRHVYRAGRVAIDRLRHVALLSAPPARVLECGAGGGEFAYLLTSSGYRYTGIEPNDGYREYAREQYGVDLRPGTLDDARFDDGEFDLIVMFHVLEHVRDPGDALRRLAAWLKPGGHLYLEVPNGLTAVSSPSNLYHRAHLYYFADEPLAGLAARAGLAPALVDGNAGHANLTAIFTKPLGSTTAERAASTSPVAHDAVVNANRERTLGRYLMSGRTLAQAPLRWWQRRVENAASRDAASGRELLDRLYKNEAPRLGRGA